MTGKIFRSSFFLGISVLLISGTLFLTVLFRYYEEQTLAGLAEKAEYITRGVECGGKAYFAALHTGERITWVASDGTVLYDSKADAHSMGNHLDRAEIAQALRDGAGQSIHASKTLVERTLYYAVRASDGTVVRVSCTQRAIVAMLLVLVRPLLWGTLVVLALCALLALRLARQITRPINAIDLEEPTQSGAYPELTPLITKLQEQNRTIRRQMDELSLKQREFSAITDNTSEGFLLVDSRMTVLSSNCSAEHILRCEEGGKIENLRQSGCNPQVVRAVETALTGTRTEQLMERDGVSWQIIANPVISNGQIAGVVVIVMDVTEREQREGLRREFSANVSHELKTPLTSITGFAELMMEGLVPMEKVREFSSDIYRESRRLIDLVNDIINLSALDEDSQTFVREPVDLYALAEELLASLQIVARRQQVTLTLTGTHESVSGVRQILSEMIYNLCDNAVKYNHEGGTVTVSVRRSGAAVCLSVADTGIGIPYASQSRVFERFYRVDKSHSKEIGGTGLGLSIVKHAAQFHGARLELQSEPGKGTTITVIF